MAESKPIILCNMRAVVILPTEASVRQKYFKVQVNIRNANTYLMYKVY